MCRGKSTAALSMSLHCLHTLPGIGWTSRVSRHAISFAIRNLYEEMDVFRWAAHGSALRDAPAQRLWAARSRDDESLFRAAEKSADAWFDLRECCNEDAAARSMHVHRPRHAARDKSA
ncbi:hypothetical protein BCAR13_70024 [Paraburkholderia caribensis]|nr:hypothetical protein BCAR13_70024 [Paraburkholderia caribensis]